MFSDLYHVLFVSIAIKNIYLSVNRNKIRIFDFNLIIPIQLLASYGNRFLQIIKTRRSCRKYKKEQITDEELKAVLEAGTYAPTSRGMQSPYIVAVQNEELRKQLASMNAHVMGVTSNPYYDAPTYVLVLVPADANNPIQDGSCVLENMMLAAHAIGLGSCWIHREREMFSTPEGKELMKSWGLPEGLVGIGALALGYPAEEPAQPKPRKQDYYRVIK